MMLAGISLIANFGPFSSGARACRSEPPVLQIPSVLDTANRPHQGQKVKASRFIPAGLFLCDLSSVRNKRLIRWRAYLDQHLAAFDLLAAPDRDFPFAVINANRVRHAV